MIFIFIDYNIYYNIMNSQKDRISNTMSLTDDEKMRKIN